jgi:hypothetical protein
VGRVDGDGQRCVGDPPPVDGAEQRLLVRPAGALDLALATDLVPRGRVWLFEAGLDRLERVGVGLAAVWSDHLQAVVRRGVVRGRHHDRGHALVVGVRLRSGRRQGADAVDVEPRPGQPGGRGAGEHRACLAGVAGERDPRFAAVAPRGPDGAGQPGDERRRYVLSHDAPDAAGAEHVHAGWWRGAD